MTSVLPTTPLASFDKAMFMIKQPHIPQNIEKIKETAQEFEAVFISQMMSHMFKGIKSDSMFGGGFGEDMFSSLLVAEYGKQMAKGEGIGIAKQLQKAIIEMQEQN